MNHPEPALGSAQVKILKKLQAAGVGTFIGLPEERALDKLWKKGYVRWQAAQKGKEWAITPAGVEALGRKG